MTSSRSADPRKGDKKDQARSPVFWGVVVGVPVVVLAAVVVYLTLGRPAATSRGPTQSLEQEKQRMRQDLQREMRNR